MHGPTEYAFETAIEHGLLFAAEYLFCKVSLEFAKLNRLGLAIYGAGLGVRPKTGDNLLRRTKANEIVVSWLPVPSAPCVLDLSCAG